MSDAESLDYLQPDFDPVTLTVPRLRSILVTYNINYPATAKKAQLIDIFNDQLVPQAKKILNQRARAKRSSKGIIDVTSSASSSTAHWGDEQDDHEQMLPPPTRRSKSPRKSTRAAKQESEEPEHQQLQPAPALVPSPRKRSARSASRQAPSDTDTDGDGATAARSVRATSRRAVTPNVKLEPPAEESPLFQHIAAASTDDDDAVFTSDNPFQSGSSPPQAPKSSTRRRTAGPDTGLAKTSATPGKAAARRRTDGAVFGKSEYDDEDSRTAAFEIPVSALKPRAPQTPDQTEFEAGEEFTPEAQLELAQEEAARNQHSVATRRQQQPRRKGINWATPLWVLFLTILGAYAYWYRQEKIKVGYCGLGQPAMEVLPPEVMQQLPDWAIILVEPQCDDCPAHARCTDDFAVQCNDDYILKPHPLSLGGLVPLPPTCEPDGEKVRRVKAVADRAVEELRERRAKFECGELVDEDGKLAETAAIEESILKEVIGEKRSRKMGKEEFDDLWTAALGDIKDRDEVEVEEEEPEDDDRPVAGPTEPEVAEPFRPRVFRPALSLAFRSPVRSAAPSDSDWSDIDSALLL